MKNSDLPAMPITYEAEYPSSIGYEKRTEVEFGLTKREMFAMAAMQGLIASGATYKGSTTNRHLLAADAVSHADALLTELERTK